MWFFHKRRFQKLVDEKEAEKNFAQIKPELEKGDPPAMVIAALLVFMPYVLAFIGVLLLIAWLLGVF
ncbi:MAG: hypothetical protein LBQ89_01010 [Treponema sp.]|jgi:UPF0716 family protein affecting phage T7 exclusion|nr:hypothetical protein [Treponema sp.]